MPHALGWTRGGVASELPSFSQDDHMISLGETPITLCDETEEWYGGACVELCGVS